MRVNVAIPEPHVSAPVLGAALEAVTRLDESMIRNGELEPFDPAHPQARWRPEPPGQGEHFDHGRLVSARGWGDCDDLAPWHAASLRATGRDRGAKAFVRRSGPTRWHALVRRSDGRIEDPSLAAGMPGRGRRHGVRGAAQPMMIVGSSSVGSYIARPQLAVRPMVEPGGYIESWQARTDLPWHTYAGTSPGDIAMVSLHRSPYSDQSLVGALEGAIALGESSDVADDEHLERLRCLSDMVQGASWEECAREYGPTHASAAGHVVGKLFGKHFLKKLVRTAVNPLRVIPGGKMLDPERLLRSKLVRKGISKGLQFIPGVGPLASSAFDAASPMLQKALTKNHHVRPSLRHRLPPAAAPAAAPRTAASPVTINIFNAGKRAAYPGAAAVER